MADDIQVEVPVNVVERDNNVKAIEHDPAIEKTCSVDDDRDSNTDVAGEKSNVPHEDHQEPNGEQTHNIEDDKTPQVGMAFKTYAEACYFYKQYAQRAGFGATVRRSHFKQKECLHLVLACCKWGKGKEGEEYQSRPTAKTNCLASMKLKLREGLLHAENVNLEHNHELNRSIAKSSRCFKILSNNKVLRPNPENKIHLIREKEGDNSIVRRRLKLGQGDDEAFQHFFTRLQNKSSNFFYLMDLDEEGCLCNVFWADSRARAAYKYFGDVVSIDTTYVSDEFDIPLVLFLGVNHHGQSVLLGCGLVSRDIIENYIWVFKTWISCMQGKLPNAIVTNHCKVIQGAVSEVFVGVQHRLCLYHIMRKMPKKLREYAASKDIMKVLEKAVYDSLTVEDFEEKWRDMIERYNLEGCEWLTSLYRCRQIWVPLFLHGTFWAGISTYQQNESVTPFFDGVLSLRTTLKHFFSIYDTVLQSKYEKEVEADSVPYNGYWRMLSKFPMEEQLSKLYTLSMFKIFQDELKATMYCDVSLVKLDDITSTFKVKESVFSEDGKITKSKDYEVLYNANEVKVHCMCGSFQFRGILCKHSLAVLKFQQIYEMPSHYILNRWRRDYKRLHLMSQSCDDDVSKTPMERYNYLSMSCLKLLEVGLVSDDKYQLALKLIKGIERHLLDDLSQGDGHQINLNGSSDGLITLQIDLSHGQQLHDSSQQVKRRGRPPKKRKEVETEEIARSTNATDSSVTPLIDPMNANLGTHACPQGGTNLVVAKILSFAIFFCLIYKFFGHLFNKNSFIQEDLNLNNLSSSSHYGIQFSPDLIAGPSGIQPSMMEEQYIQQNIGNQSRPPWI